MDLARLSTTSTAQLLARKRPARGETMRTLLFAAFAALTTTNVAVAQDDNAISNLISNPIL